MSQSEPAISVVLPTLNRAATLPRAIESVLSQEFREIELIVVDDGSTDATPESIARFRDERLSLVRSERTRGANWARNRGIRAAHAPIVAFLDSDDVYLPGKLSRIAEFFETNPEIDALVDSFVVRSSVGATDGERKKINPVLTDRRSFRVAVFQRRIRKATSALSVRRSALEEVGGFDESLSRRQDFDIVARLARGHGCASVDEILWVKHKTEGCISDSSITFLEASIAICDRHPEYLDEFPSDLYRDLRSHFTNLAKKRRWSTLWLDGQRYREHTAFELPLHRLLLDYRISSKSRATLPATPALIPTE